MSVINAMHESVECVSFYPFAHDKSTTKVEERKIQHENNKPQYKQEKENK
jgi:hypothetical protein